MTETTATGQMAETSEETETVATGKEAMRTETTAMAERKIQYFKCTTCLCLV